MKPSTPSEMPAITKNAKAQAISPDKSAQMTAGTSRNRMMVMTLGTVKFVRLLPAAD
jgi:hypothetical protein